MMPAVSTVLEVHDVHKRYRAVKAVDGLSFDVGAGEIVALLGPNGAGKTTTVRMINGIIPPDAGSIAATGSTATRRPGWAALKTPPTAAARRFRSTAPCSRWKNWRTCPV